MLSASQLLVTDILSASLFTGASIYINLVEQSARMSCGTALAVTEFAPTYKRAAILHLQLALNSFLTALTAWFLESGISQMFGGILTVLYIPLTALAILPINKQLLDPTLDKNYEKAYQLSNYWGNYMRFEVF